MALNDQILKSVLGVPREAVLEFTKVRKDATGAYNRRTLTEMEEIVLFFIYFRLYVPFLFISVLFGVSTSVVYSTIADIRDILYVHLKPEINGEDYEYRKSRGVTFFKQVFTFSIDGTEQRVNSADNSCLNTLFYSAKKKYPSINKIIVVSLDGRILWMSGSYGGIYNDSTILRQDSSFRIFLRRDECGFGDNGFNACEDLGIYTTPNKLDGLYSNFSRYRIIIENVNAHMKEFSACSSPMREKIGSNEKSILKIHHQNWYIAGCLYNRYNKRCN